MRKQAFSILGVLAFALPCAMFSQSHSMAFDARYSAQISNASAGNCGCFSLQGGAADFYLNAVGIGGSHGAGLGAAIDVGSEHTASVNGAPYGLTLTTLTFGPRIVLPGHKIQPFAQVLLGFAHGSDSAFPAGNILVPSASSFALDIGGAADYSINKRLSVRFVQVDYLRTSLPNISSNWQNNLRVAAGVTLHFAH
ncbi:MAG: hypothetical protein WBE56_12510 [Terracidiphilus sp.]